METYNDSELYHHGILGQKWGVRRFQNPDGSLTEEGRERYSSSNRKSLGDRVHEHRVKKALKTGKNLKVLTDDELRDALNRINNEANYKRTYEYLHPPKAKKERKPSRSKRVVGDALEYTIRKALNKAGDNFVNSIFNTYDSNLESEIRRLENEDKLEKVKNKADLSDYDREIKEYKAFKDNILSARKQSTKMLNKALLNAKTAEDKQKAYDDWLDDMADYSSMLRQANPFESGGGKKKKK